MSKNNWKTTKMERLSYGGYSIGQNIAYLTVLQYLMLFYTDVVGIGAAAVGMMFFVARTWDAINDPLLGIIVDKTNFKSGKFTPWIKTVIFLIPLSTFILFLSPDLGPTGKLVFAYVSYIVWGMIYTISDVPFFAVSTVMTGELDERVQLITIGRIASMIGGVFGIILFMPLVKAIGWTGTVLILCALMVMTMLPSRFFIRERIQHDRSSGISLKEILCFVTSNKPMIVYYAAFLLLAIFNTMQTVGNYFAIYLLNDTDGSKIAMLGMMMFLPSLVVVPMLPMLISRLGKKKLYIWGSLIGIVSNIAMYFMGYSNFTVVMVMNGIRGAASMLPLMTMGMFSQDFVEYGAHKTGKRAEGIAFSVQTFATKLSGALGAVLVGFMLEKVYNYVPNVQQSPETMKGIWDMYTLYPVAGLAAGLLVMLFFYDLKEKDVQSMIDTEGCGSLTPQTAG